MENRYEILNCCKNCPRRKVGCHNEETCEDWKKRVQLNEEIKIEKKRLKEYYYTDSIIAKNKSIRKR